MNYTFLASQWKSHLFWSWRLSFYKYGTRKEAYKILILLQPITNSETCWILRCTVLIMLQA